MGRNIQTVGQVIGSCQRITNAIETGIRENAPVMLLALEMLQAGYQLGKAEKETEKAAG